MRQSDFDLPKYDPIETDFQSQDIPLGEYSFEGIQVDIGKRDNKYIIDIIDGGNYKPSQILWTIVHWCRDAGVPGVWKSRIKYDGMGYRVGALYMIAGFELTERESNYTKYGETAYDPENEELGHG